MDPMLAVSLGTLIGSAFSFLMGSAPFTCLHTRFRPEWHERFEQKMAIYANHVARHRANAPPSPASLSGTDFYGERVSSLRDYRHWLKRQNALKSSKPSSLSA
jgi:import inner membrane translocase subunit TIM23